MALKMQKEMVTTQKNEYRACAQKNENANLPMPNLCFDEIESA
jgi:hypothetical protein